MKLKFEEITGQILKIYFETYNRLGYGFNQQIYKNAFLSTLRQTNLKIEKNKLIDVYFEIEHIGQFAFDMVIDQKIAILITNDDHILDKEIRRLFNFLKASEYEVGFVLNFGISPQYKRRELI